MFTIFFFMIWFVTALLFAGLGAYLAERLGWPGVFGALIGFFAHFIGIGVLSVLVIVRAITDPRGPQLGSLIAPLVLLFLILFGGIHQVLIGLGFLAFGHGHGLLSIVIVGAIAYTAVTLLQQRQASQPVQGGTCTSPTQPPAF